MIQERDSHQYLHPDILYRYEEYVDFLRKYLKETEFRLQKEKKGLSDLIEKLTKENPEEPFVSLGEEDFFTSEIIPNLLFTSVFLLGYSLFERYLYELAERISIDNGINFSLKEIKGDSDFAKIIKLIKNQKQVTLESITSEYDDINQIRKIRNSIAHFKKMKELELKTPLLEKYFSNGLLKLNKTVSTTENQIEIINSKFITESLERTEKFATKIMIEINKFSH